MKRHNVFFIAIICAIAPVFCAPAAVSKCQKTGLQRCLDSACAINIGMNPSARCQYCGTSSAGNPPSQKGLSNITAGQSTKYVLTDQELRVAPSDPGRRYIWATTECIKKLPDCTTDDVSDLYDKLIEQSCKAAGVSMQVTSAMEAINKKPTKSSCNDTFTTCMNKKCGTAYENCEDGTTFTKTIAECATEASGCDDYITEFRNAITNDRKSMYTLRESVLQTLVKNYQSTRESKLAGAKSNCKSGETFNSCVAAACSNNMPNKCENNKTERSMAEKLCQFYKTACTVLK